MCRLIGVLILLVFFIPFSSFCQYFTIDTIRAHSPYDGYHFVSYVFPHLTSATDQAAADLINRALMRGVLHIDSGDVYESIFQGVWVGEPSAPEGIADLSFKEINNDTDFFCIAISGVDCDVNNNPFIKYYVRESKSGRAINIEDLFLNSGLQKLSESVRIMRNKRLQQHIELLKKIPKGGMTKDGEAPEIYLPTYKECIDTSHEVHNLAGDAPDDSDLIAEGRAYKMRYLESYALDRKTLTILTGVCVDEVISYVDKVDYTFTFKLRKLKKYLSPYGKSLLKL